MQIQVTRKNEIGQADHGWLQARHYFSFANYYNPQRMGFGALRVINDDTIQGGTGFGTHPHQNMEIITIPQEGSLEHKDSFGNQGVIEKGEVQVMSAGTGILHSEFNHSKENPLKLFQIWIESNKKNVSPRYDQKRFDYHKNLGQWTQMVSPISEESEPGLKIYQQAYINGTKLAQGQSLDYQSHQPQHGLYILLVSGLVEIAGEKLNDRDSLAVSQTSLVSLLALEESEVLVIEVPLT